LSGEEDFIWKYPRFFYPYIFTPQRQKRNSQYPFSQFGLAVPAMSSLKLWLSSRLLAFGDADVWREIHDAVRALLTHSKNLLSTVWSTLFYPQMQSTAPCEMLWRKLTPSQPDSVQYGDCSAYWCMHCFVKMLVEKL